MLISLFRWSGSWICWLELLGLFYKKKNRICLIVWIPKSQIIVKCLKYSERPVFHFTVEIWILGSFSPSPCLHRQSSRQYRHSSSKQIHLCGQLLSPASLSEALRRAKGHSRQLQSETVSWRISGYFIWKLYDLRRMSVHYKWMKWLMGSLSCLTLWVFSR